MKIIGVRLRQAGKIHYYTPGDIQVAVDDKVIVETARGMELGKVVVGVKEVNSDEMQQSVKRITRLATKQDIQAEKDNELRVQEAIDICREKVRAHDLQMKIIKAEFTFDNNKVLFYFTADGRIDFRELVKDLASVFRMRIELRQIGVRDETKIRGGIGICGRELCCSKYLTDFSPVSIKMAKNQNISLNPTKISGVCGRLMCCLSNEEATYEELNSNLPPIGAKVETKDGKKGDVVGVTILKQRVKVAFISKNGEKEFVEMDVEELSFTGSRKQQLNELNGEVDESVAKILDEEKNTKVSARNNRDNKKSNESINPGLNGRKDDNRKNVKRGKDKSTENRKKASEAKEITADKGKFQKSNRNNKFKKYTNKDVNYQKKDN